MDGSVSMEQISQVTPDQGSIYYTGHGNVFVNGMIRTSTGVIPSPVSDLSS